MKTALLLLTVLAAAACGTVDSTSTWQTADSERSNNMDLGAFSVSLAVKDLAASRAFYEKLGFAVIGGEQEQNWLILKNGASIIGLFQGMFDKNTLTFNPGWDGSGGELSSFTDVRELKSELAERGIESRGNTDESESGPAHIMLFDPDGNPILIDQHV